MTVIAAKHYAQEDAALKRDQLTLKLAGELAQALWTGEVKLAELQHGAGQPTFEFMKGANDRWHKLDTFSTNAERENRYTGEFGFSIGGIAKALLSEATSVLSAKAKLVVGLRTGELPEVLVEVVEAIAETTAFSDAELQELAN